MSARPARGPFVALFGGLLAMAIVHALVAFWTPVQGDDWLHAVWRGQHPDAGLGTWLASHWTFSEAIGYVLARVHAVHVIVTPAVDVALVIGVFVLATRRVPRAEWPDVLGVALVSAMIWIAQPHAGVTWFYTPSVALHVYGVAIAVWFVAPWRCGWQVPRALWPVLALAGYCVGTSSRAIATATLIGVLLGLRALPRERRVRWMWIALGGLVVGVVAGYLRAPLLEVGRVVRRGLEPNLILLKMPIEEAGRLVSLVAVLIVVRALARLATSDDARPDASDTLRWSIGWFATAIWCLFGPRYYEATLLPATCLLVIAALPYLRWLATSRPLRFAIIAFAIAVHAVVWPVALVLYHRYGTEAVARTRALEAGRPGELAIIAPYSQILPTFWFFGEDLSAARLRQQVALDVLGLRDISIVPQFRRIEANPQIGVKLEVDRTAPPSGGADARGAPVIDGITDAELAAAHVPARWSGVPSVARDQFGQLIKRLRSVTGKPVSARLVVTNVTFAQRGTRPLLLAWSDDTGTEIPRTAISPVDEENQFTIRIYGDDIKHFDEAWIIDDGVATSTPYRNGSPRLRPPTTRLDVLVVCNPTRCLVADALVPRF